MDEYGVEAPQAADIAAHRAQGLAGQLTTPLPAVQGEPLLPLVLFLSQAGLAFGFGSLVGSGWRRPLAGVAVPVGGDRRRLLQDAVRSGLGRPQL